MSHFTRQKAFFASIVAALIAVAGVAAGGQAPAPVSSAMNNPDHLVPGWPTMLPQITWGQAIGIQPDGTGGLWLQHRSDPPVIHFDASGKALRA